MANGVLPSALWPHHTLHMAVARLFAVHVDRALVSSPEAPETSHLLYAQHPLTRIEVAGTITEVRILSGGERLCMLVDDGTGSTQAVMYLVNQDGSPTHHHQPSIGEMVCVAGRLGWGYRSATSGGRCREISVVSSVRRLATVEELSSAWLEVCRLHLVEYVRPVSHWLVGVPASDATCWDAPVKLRRSAASAPASDLHPSSVTVTGKASAPRSDTVLPTESPRAQEHALVIAALEGAVLQAVVAHGLPAAMSSGTSADEDGTLPPPPIAPPTIDSQCGVRSGLSDVGSNESIEFDVASITDAVRRRLPPALWESLASAAPATDSLQLCPSFPSPFRVEDRISQVLQGFVERGLVYKCPDRVSSDAAARYRPVTVEFLRRCVSDALKSLASTPAVAAGYAGATRGWTAKDVCSVLSKQGRESGASMRVPVVLVRDTLTWLAAADDGIFCIGRDRFFVEAPAATLSVPK